MTIWGKLLAESCILFLNWYQNALGPIATAWAIGSPGNTDPEEESPIFLPKERGSDSGHRFPGCFREPVIYGLLARGRSRK
jgi:hypothetical protein